MRDLAYYSIRYDIKLSCKDCKSLFVNGNAPVNGTTAEFKSDVPMQATLFCGDYKIARSNGTYILNPDINEEQMGKLGERTSYFKKYFETKLRIPYDKNITYVHTTPTYSYNYAALVFLAIEKEIGEQRMWEWLHNILVTKTAYTNYSFLEQTLDDVLKDKDKLALIKSKFFTSDKSVENIQVALK